MTQANVSNCKPMALAASEDLRQAALAQCPEAGRRPLLRRLRRGAVGRLVGRGRFSRADGQASKWAMPKQGIDILVAPPAIRYKKLFGSEW